MPFNIYEQSPFSGSAVELYEFRRTSDDVDIVWRYCTTDRDITYGGEVFKAVAISDSGVKLNSEASSTDLTVTLPITEDFCQDFRLLGTVPSDSVFLRIYRIHGFDIENLDDGIPTVGDARLTWIGTVNGLTQTDDITAKVTCAMLAASFRRGGLRYGYQRSCPHVLYGSMGCKKNRNDFKITATVSAVSTTQVESADFASKPDGWFTGGYIEYLLPSGATERRMISIHASTTAVLIGFPAGLAVGDSISAFAGCDRLVKTCDDKFDNLDNFGGFPHSPGRNPFDGQPLF